MEAKKGKKRQKRQKKAKELFLHLFAHFCPFCFSIFPAKVSYRIEVGPSCSIAYPKMSS